MNLDEQIGADDVDDEVIQWHLEAISGPGHPVLDTPVKSAFIEGSDVRRVGGRHFSVSS